MVTERYPWEGGASPLEAAAAAAQATWPRRLSPDGVLMIPAPAEAPAPRPGTPDRQDTERATFEAVTWRAGYQAGRADLITEQLAAQEQYADPNRSFVAATLADRDAATAREVAA